jgi:ankyrin repeat protein
MDATARHQDRQGVTPLHSASFAGHEKVTRLLLKSGAGHALQDDEGCDPLLQALWNNDEGVAKALVNTA